VEIPTGRESEANSSPQTAGALVSCASFLSDPARDRRNRQSTIRFSNAGKERTEQRIVLTAGNVHIHVATRHHPRSQSMTRLSGPRVDVGANMNMISVFATGRGE